MAATARMTLDEWLLRPDTEPSSEFACGEVLQKPTPNLPHAALERFFVVVLQSFVLRLRLGFVGPEVRCIFGPASGTRGYVPDVVFISRAKLPATDVRALVPFRAPPDLAIEILSPDQEMGRFTEKIQFYLRHGVRLVWVVDPIAETVTVHNPNADSFTLSVGDTLDGGDVLPGLTISVGDIFAALALDGDAVSD